MSQAKLSDSRQVLEAPEVCCPVVHVPDVAACDVEELRPLLDFLRSHAAGAVVAEPVFFPRGAILPGGRLDACKQSLGPGGARHLARALEGCSDIRAILLGTGAIGDEGAQDVARLIERNPNLETIYLGCNAITARGVQVLARAIEPSPNVRGLWLKRNPIGSAGVAFVAQMLKGNRALDTLDIVNCGFEASALSPLCDVLQRWNRTLHRLYIGSNGLGLAQAAELGCVLQSNSSLEALLLNANHLGNEGARELSWGLARNSWLLELGLGSNGLSARGLKPLCQAVATHPALEALDLGRAASETALGAPGNDLGAEGAALIATMLRQNRSLRRLNLRGTGIRRHEAAQVLEAATQHPVLSDLQMDGPLSPQARENLARNRQSRGEWSAADEVQAIRSVYRTPNGKG